MARLSHRLFSFGTWVVLPALFLSIIAGAWTTSVSAQDSTPAADVKVGVLEGNPVYIACDTNVTADASDANATPVPADSPSTTYALTADSVASYTAEEELASQGANTAVGTTNTIIGNVYFDADGNPMACSRVDVDMRTFVSDESRRDNFLRSNTLETDTYPVATFVMTSVEGLNGALINGQETSFYLVGNLTMHGVTKLVRWEVTATLDGDDLTGKANTEFEMTDFNITEPKVGPVLSVDSTIKLEIDIVATKS
jgi:polyisoprenoid-binding protein YceI